MFMTGTNPLLANEDVRNRPIGVFDSGIGGLTVLREIWNLLPNESTVYFGDSGRYPYGTKSHDTIVQYSGQNMRFLLSRNVKMIVIACNSAGAHAHGEVRRLAGVPVVEVITPGAEQAVKETRNGRIGIIATRATVSSGLYSEAVREAADRLIEAGENREALSLLSIEQVACPLFVSLAEEGYWNQPATRLIAEDYLAGLRESGVDVLILGCTHYPLLGEVIGEVMGPQTRLIDSGTSGAQRIRKTLSENGLTRTDASPSSHRFYTSDDPEMFEQRATPFLGGGRPSGTLYVATDSFTEGVRL
jgi:glutamate racemase